MFELDDFGVDTGGIEDGLYDLFGTSVEDSYHNGYNKGYHHAGSQHQYEFRRGLRDGRLDRESVWDSEAELDDWRF